MKRFFGALALAIAAVLAVPGAASAYGELAGPSSALSGASATYTATNVPEGITSVDFAVNGPGDVILAGLVTITKPVVAGAASVNVTFPSSGVYTVTASGGEGETAFSNTFTVTVALPAADSGLPNTGGGVDAVPALWLGSGLLLLGGLAVGVFAAVRRSNRASA